MIYIRVVGIISYLCRRINLAVRKDVLSFDFKFSLANQVKNERKKEAHSRHIV